MNEAQEYEKREDNKKKEKLKRYKCALASKLKVFKAVNSDQKILYFAIIVNCNHSSYAYAMAESKFGKHYTLDNTGLRVNWTLEELQDDDLYASILDCIAYGKPAEARNLVGYQGIPIDIDDTQCCECSRTYCFPNM